MAELSLEAPKLPPDPGLQAEEAQAQNALNSSQQTLASGDMASLMARYGTMLALGGNSMSPMISRTTGGMAPAIVTGKT